MKNRIKRIISGALAPIADWVRRKPLVAVVLAILLIWSCF